MNFSFRLSNSGLSLGLQLRDARRYRHLTQERAAHRARVDLDTLQSLESGRGTVGPLLKILDALEHRFRDQGIGAELGPWLAEQRQVAGLSQQKLAVLTGLSKPTIIQIERGRGHIDSLCLVLSALEIQIALRPDEAAAGSFSGKGMSQTPLRYPGGKTKALKVLASHLPHEIDEFRDPFVGGGSVALYISLRFPNASIWINDSYAPLVAFWTVLQDPARASEMKKCLRALKLRHPDKASARELFHQLGHDMHDPDADDLTRATAFYVTNRCSFSGLTQSGSFSPQASQVRWTMGHIERLTELTPRISKWRITNVDFEEVLGEPWSGSAAFAFLDPPYAIKGTGLYGYRGNTHTGFDHKRLRSIAEKASCRVLITYNSSPMLRRMYAGWQQVSYDLGYSVRSCQTYRARQKIRQELLIRNYHVWTGERIEGL